MERSNHVKQETKERKVLNENINSAKYDYAIGMEIKKIKICFPKKPYSLHLGIK